MIKIKLFTNMEFPEKFTIIFITGEVGWPGDVARIRLDSHKLHELGWEEKYSSRKAVKQTITDNLP